MSLINVGDSQTFNYNGDIQSLEITTDGLYKFDIYGARGGSYGRGGYGAGGHSVGYKTLKKGDKLYIGVGGAGWSNGYSGAGGGYNGGGSASRSQDQNYSMNASGGGATHIALNNNLGVLANYSANKDDLLIIAGGGGGGSWHTYYDRGGSGGNGGGLNAGDSSGYYGSYAGGTQTTGYAFGQGCNNGNGAGGGGGLYGGQGGNYASAGGGSGFIDNVPSITINGTTYTPSTTNGGSSGNGSAVITLIYKPFAINLSFNSILGNASYSWNDDFTIATLQATANTNFKFVGWYIDDVLQSENATYELSVNQDVTIEARFDYQYSINLTYDTSLGSATITRTYDSPNIVTLLATPNSNGQFKGWYLNSSPLSTSNPYIYTITSNTTIEARFDRVWSIDDRVNGDGAIEYTRGTDKNDVTFNVIPNANRHFTKYEVETTLSALFPYGMNKINDVSDLIEDFGDGTGKATRRFDGIDASACVWTWNSAWEVWTTSILSAKRPIDNYHITNCKSAKYKMTSIIDMISDNSVKNIMAKAGTSANFFVRTESQSILPSGTILFELEEPIETDLDIDLSFQSYVGGSEELIPQNTSLSLLTTSMLADIQYPDELRTNQQIIYRESPTTVDGVAKINKLYGNTIKFNQLIDNFTSGRTISGVSFVNNGDGSWTLNGTATANTFTNINYHGSTTSPDNMWLYANHKYYIKGAGALPSNCGLQAYALPSESFLFGFTNDNIYTSTQTTQMWIRFYITQGSVFNNLNAYPMIFDLTQMGIDSFTTPQQVEEWLSSNISALPCYPYSLGSLISFNGTGLKTTGKNLLKVSPNIEQYTTNGVTVTPNNDGTFVVNGTPSVSGAFMFYTNLQTGYTLTNASQCDFKKHFKNGEYILSTGMSTALANVQLSVANDDVLSTIRIIAQANVNDVNVVINDSYLYNWNRIVCNNNGSFDNFVIKPMVRFANVEDNTFETYKESTLTFTTIKSIHTTTPLYLHLLADIVITAFFEEDDKYHITVSTTFENGSIYLSDNDVYAQTVVTLWARPFPDYVFVKWEDGSYENPRSIIVTQNVTMIAEYQRLSDTNGIYQYRCFVKDQLDLEASPKAFLVADTFTVKPDLMTNSTSTINVQEMPSNINIGDVIVLYDPKGQFLYNGVIKSIDDLRITCSQMQSFYKGLWIYNTHPSSSLEEEIAYLLGQYSQGKIYGSTYTDSLVAQRLGGITIDFVANTSANLPTDLDKDGNEQYSTKDMEQFIYELYENYGIVFNFEINLVGTNYVHIKVPNYETIKVGNNMFAIQNMLPMTTIEETNRLIIFSSQKVYRTTYVATKNGIVEQPTSTVNRFDITNTKVVFSDDDVSDLISANLPSSMFNHKIEYDLIIKNFIYEFGDFNLGGELDIYYGDDYYNSVLTGYEITKASNQNITRAHFVCGKVRTKLTKRLTLGNI